MTIYNSPTVHSPKTSQELLSLILKNPQAKIFAGGTFLMNRQDYYNDPIQSDIISISEISELSRTIHMDRYLEVGANVTFLDLEESGSLSFSEELNRAFSDIGNTLIKSRATLGGALCTDEIRFSVPCFLAAAGTQTEVRTVVKGLFGITTYGRWVPVAKLYDQDGHFAFRRNSFVTKIRIPYELPPYQFFRTAGNPMQDPDNTVCVGLLFSVNQQKIVMSGFYLVIPSCGMFTSQNFENRLATSQLPLPTAMIVRTAQDLVNELQDKFPQATDLVLERTFRLIKTVLFDANTKFLTE